MRKDAAARRERLIQAAATLFEQDGYDIPLEAVAAAAGVGRGTLYRNFPDRAALMAAVLTHKLTIMEGLVAMHEDDATLLITFVRHQGLIASLHAPAVTQLVTDASQRDVLKTLTDRTSNIVEQIVTRSHAAGTLRHAMTAAHLRLITRMLMVTGRWPHGDMQDGLDMAIDIVMRGMIPH